MVVKVVDALILVTAAQGMHKDLVAALAMQEDDTYTTYKIRGISQVYEVSSKLYDAVVAVTAKDSNEITKIETAIKSLTSTKGKGPLVKKTHLMQHWIKMRGDP